MEIQVTCSYPLASSDFDCGHEMLPLAEATPRHRQGQTRASCRAVEHARLTLSVSTDSS